MTDLVFIDEGNPDRNDDLLNMFKITLYSQSVMQARDLLRLPFQGMNVDIPLALALRNLEQRSDDECYQRSLAIFPRGAEAELD
jgi:hypothetical protein